MVAMMRASMMMSMMMAAMVMERMEAEGDVVWVVVEACEGWAMAEQVVVVVVEAAEVVVAA